MRQPGDIKLAAALAVCLGLVSGVVSGAEIALVCAPGNDLYRALVDSGVACTRRESIAEAVEGAAPDSAVLILAEGYPEVLTRVPPELLEKAAARKLRLFIEYPEALPGLQVEKPRRSNWERVVVGSDAFGASLPRLRILMVQDCHFVPTTAADPLLVLGRVAGFDRAVFGLPQQSFPILFEIPEQRLTIATTRLSSFVTGRYAPVQDWRELWQKLLQRLAGQAVVLKCTPTVHPAYGPDDPLPPDAEQKAIAGYTQWVHDARLLVDAGREQEIHTRLRRNAEESPMPAANTPSGDGTRGLLEGFSSRIRCDGSQEQRLPLRTDCHAETALCMALDWRINGNATSRRIAESLLDFVFFTSGAQRGVRGDPRHPAFGHVAWGVISPAWEIANYGDDDARVIRAAIIAAAILQQDRWDEPILRALLANLRTTGRHGFRGGRIDVGPLEKLGWKHFQEGETIHYSPHYEAALWTTFLWAYHHTRYEPFLEKPRAAIRKTMQVYPDQWLWQNNLERARMLLCLAWLVRVDDTQEHRTWLKRMCDDLLAYQDSCGAIAEVAGVRGNAHYHAPTSNEEYGTREMPIVQEGGDAASDQLYVSGFVLDALHETAAVLPDPQVKEAEDRLSAFLCRIQVRSQAVPYVNGGWFRAFDFKRWEYWAASGDSGWGAWSLEAGWGQAWGAATMGMRCLRTNTWALTADSRIGLHMKAVQQLMAVSDGAPWKAPATAPASSNR